MKNLICSVGLILSLLFIAIILQCCSSENGITSPPDNKTTALEKVVSAPIIHLNHSMDTIITLPKSKIQIVVNKTYPTDKLAIMDDYYTTHTPSSTTVVTPSGISPNYQYCPFHYDTLYVLLEDFQHAPGKHMGIWVTPDVISWSTAYNKYAFDELLIGPSDISTATGISFKLDSLMVSLGSNEPSAVTLFEEMYENNGYPVVGYYFVDEPNANGWSVADMQNLASLVAYYTPNKKLMFTEYDWPWFNFNCMGNSGDYSTVGGYLTPNNTGVMCDMYNLSNGCGDMAGYWAEYWGTYNQHSWMNWADNTGSNAGNWPYCFNFMNGNGFNNVWLYASGTGNEGIIQNWCDLAWQKSWLLKHYGYLVQVWENTDGTCNWSTGTWTLYNSYYIASGYAWY